jgi:lipopolysaccharide export system protein LptC
MVADAHTIPAGSRRGGQTPPATPDDGRPVGEAFRRARRHSRVVRGLKIVLPAFAVLIAVGFTAYSYLVTPGGISIDLSGSGYSDGKLTMANPKLNGFTKGNRPYSMKAARAVQDVGNTDVIRLEQIDAKLPVDDDNWAVVRADKGVYNRDKNTLDIASDMTVTTTDGMVAKLKSAFVDIGHGDMKTSDPVDITLRGTHVSADTMSIEDRGKVMVFDRNVRLTMMPERAKAAGSESGAVHADD